MDERYEVLRKIAQAVVYLRKVRNEFVGLEMLELAEKASCLLSDTDARYWALCEKAGFDSGQITVERVEKCEESIR